MGTLLRVHPSLSLDCSSPGLGILARQLSSQPAQVVSGSSSQWSFDAQNPFSVDICLFDMIGVILIFIMYINLPKYIDTVYIYFEMKFDTIFLLSLIIPSI